VEGELAMVKIGRFLKTPYNCRAAVSAAKRCFCYDDLRNEEAIVDLKSVIAWVDRSLRRP
jgi:hypothetical protein